MVAVKPREVPTKQAEKFLEGIEDDPKFVRHQHRQVLSMCATELRVVAQRHRAQRGIALIVGATVAVACAVIHQWLAFSGAAILTTVVWLALTVKILRLTEEASEVSLQIADIDREAGSSIKIIDPSTFGATPPAKAQEA